MTKKYPLGVVSFLTRSKIAIFAVQLVLCFKFFENQSL